MLPENWYSLLVGQLQKLHVHRFGRVRTILRPFRTPTMIRVAASGYINMFSCQNNKYYEFRDTPGSRRQFFGPPSTDVQKVGSSAKNGISEKKTKNHNFQNFDFFTDPIFCTRAHFLHVGWVRTEKMSPRTRSVPGLIFRHENMFI